MHERFPEDYEALFDGITMVIDAPEAWATHQERIPFFLDDTGGEGGPRLGPRQCPGRI